mmetsp:Transcript_15232/g.18363  ORF Transcript_15232/g.18363 Transcript_15232/m.18363 type:complete len:207 (-) Transcript_15232:943-1563(-)
MFGKCLRISSRGLWLMSRKTQESPRDFIWWSIARATTSRGASSSLESYSGMKRCISELSRIPPSPRTASVIKNAFVRFGNLSSRYRLVGWNWTNSIFEITALARAAIAMPSPVATGGFVVFGYTCPAPPVASSVLPAKNTKLLPLLRSMTSIPLHRTSSCTWLVTSSVAKWFSKKEMFGWECAFSSRARSISFPVKSAAWTIRLCS